MKVKCINVKPLLGNDVAPPLELNKEYEVKEVFTDSLTNKHASIMVKTQDHYDVGLVSNYNYITSTLTGLHLPNSAKGGVHWCHPSRFEIIEK